MMCNIGSGSRFLKDSNTNEIIINKFIDDGLIFYIDEQLEMV